MILGHPNDGDHWVSLSRPTRRRRDLQAPAVFPCLLCWHGPALGQQTIYLSLPPTCRRDPPQFSKWAAAGWLLWGFTQAHYMQYHKCYCTYRACHQDRAPFQGPDLPFPETWKSTLAYLYLASTSAWKCAGLPCAKEEALIFAKCLTSRPINILEEETFHKLRRESS